MKTFFDLSDHTQVAIASRTGLDNPEDLFFGLNVFSEDIHHGGSDASGTIHTAYDTVEWKAMVQLAIWIMKWDNKIRGVEDTIETMPDDRQDWFRAERLIELSEKSQNFIIQDRRMEE